MTTNNLNIRPDERVALRINDAVAVSGLSRSTLYKLINQQRLRAVKVGGRRLILWKTCKPCLKRGVNNEVPQRAKLGLARQHGPGKFKRVDYEKFDVFAYRATSCLAYNAHRRGQRENPL